MAAMAAAPSVRAVVSNARIVRETFVPIVVTASAVSVTVVGVSTAIHAANV